MGGAQSGSPRVKVGQGWGSIEDIKNVSPVGKSNSVLCPQSSPDHPCGDTVQLEARADIFRNGH